MFYTIHYLSLFCLGVLLYIFPVHEWLCHCAIIVSAFVLICLCIVYMSLYLYLWVLYTIYSLVLLHIRNLVLSLSCARVVLSMHHCYILVFTDIFVHIIYICLKKYVWVLYTIYALVVLHTGNIFIYISFIWLIPPLCHHTCQPSLTKVGCYLFVWIYCLVVTCIETFLRR